LLRKYNNYVDVDLDRNIVSLNPNLPSAMKSEGGSVLQLFEIELNTGAMA